MLLLAHKIELRPNKSQADFLAQSVGINRFAWNHCLAEWNWAYKQGFKPDKKYMLFYLKCLKERFTWINLVSSRASRVAVDDLYDAFQRFFKGQTKHPRFKKKSNGGSFAYREKQKFDISGRKLRIEKLKTRIPMREAVRFDGEHRQCTISKIAGKWFASILVKIPANPFTNKMPSSESQAVGIDLGIKEMAVLSDGTVFPASQSLKKKLKKLAKLQKRLARKVRGSNRYKRLLLKIQKLHYYVTCKRTAITHEFTDYITRTFKTIKIEDLNVNGIVKNHKLARAVSDVGFGEIRRQLEYKAELRGCEVVVVDRWFPSSKLCSRCGTIKKDLTLADRIYKCECGNEIDRDLNASLNILNWKSGHVQAGL